MTKKTCFKDRFVLPKVTRSHRYPVPSFISDKQRNVEVLELSDSETIVRWWYNDADYSEEYTLQLALDAGCVPKADGSGVTSNGFKVSLNFYEPAR